MHKYKKKKSIKENNFFFSTKKAKVVYVNLKNSSGHYKKHKYTFFKHRFVGSFMCKGLVLFKNRYHLIYLVNEEDQVEKYYRQSRFSPWELFNLYRSSFLVYGFGKKFNNLDVSKNFNNLDAIKIFFTRSYSFIKEKKYDHFISKFINIDFWLLLLLDLIIYYGNIVLEKDFFKSIKIFFL